MKVFLFLLNSYLEKELFLFKYFQMSEFVHKIFKHSISVEEKLKQGERATLSSESRVSPDARVNFCVTAFTAVWHVTDTDTLVCADRR